jgi:hypothetical protein
VSSPHAKIKEKVRISVFPQTLSFRGTAQQRVDLNPLDFYLWGDLKLLLYSAPIENGEKLRYRIFNACLSNRSQPSRNLRKSATFRDQACHACVDGGYLENML